MLCGVAAIIVPLFSAAVPQWRVEFEYMRQGLMVFLVANLLRFLWILTLKTKASPHQWNCRLETACTFVFLGFGVGSSYLCLCASLSGALRLKDYLDPCIIFGTPLLIAVLFACIRKYPIAAILSGFLIAFVKLLQPAYLNWVH